MIGSQALLCTDCDHLVIASGQRASTLSGNFPCAGWQPQRFLGHILRHYSAPTVRTVSTWHMPKASQDAVTKYKKPPDRIHELAVTRGMFCAGRSPPGYLHQASNPGRARGGLQIVIAHTPILEHCCSWIKAEHPYSSFKHLPKAEKSTDDRQLLLTVPGSTHQSCCTNPWCTHT